MATTDPILQLSEKERQVLGLLIDLAGSTTVVVDMLRDMGQGVSLDTLKAEDLLKTMALRRMALDFGTVLQDAAAARW
jgi:hypothetical protein